MCIIQRDQIVPIDRQQKENSKRKIAAGCRQFILYIPLFSLCACHLFLVSKVMILHSECSNKASIVPVETESQWCIYCTMFSEWLCWKAAPFVHCDGVQLHRRRAHYMNVHSSQFVVYANKYMRLKSFELKHLYVIFLLLFFVCVAYARVAKSIRISWFKGIHHSVCELFFFVFSSFPDAQKTQGTAMEIRIGK